MLSNTPPPWAPPYVPPPSVSPYSHPLSRAFSTGGRFGVYPPEKNFKKNFCLKKKVLVFPIQGCFHNVHQFTKKQAADLLKISVDHAAKLANRHVVAFHIQVEWYLRNFRLTIGSGHLTLLGRTIVCHYENFISAAHGYMFCVKTRLCFCGRKSVNKNTKGNDAAKIQLFLIGKRKIHNSDKKNPTQCQKIHNCLYLRESRFLCQIF